MSEAGPLPRPPFGDLSLGAAARSAGECGNEGNTMLIDMHAHVVPDTLRAPRSGAVTDRWPVIDRSGEHPVLVMGQTRFTATPLWWNLEQRLASMDASGVDGEVISPLPTFLNYASRRAPGSTSAVPSTSGWRDLWSARPAAFTLWASCPCRTQTWRQQS